MFKHVDTLEDRGPLNVRDVLAPPPPLPAAEPQAEPAPVTLLAPVQVDGRPLWTDPRA